MKTKFILLAVSFVLCLPVFAGSKKKADKDTEHFRYEIECAGNGAQGTYLVKVYSYSKKPNVAAEQCKKNAVHGIIFKGYSGGLMDKIVDILPQNTSRKPSNRQNS